MRRMVRAPLLAFVAALVAVPVMAQAPNWPSERPPRPLRAHDVKFPPFAVRTLSNGLQVIAVPHHEQPAISLRLVVRAGGAQDPSVKPGVAYLTAALLDQGTTTRSAEQIATTIDSIGGLLGTGSGSDVSFVTAIVMKDSFDVGMDLLSDLVRNPAFAPEEIERQRQQMLSTLKVSYDDPKYIAGVVFDRLVYGVHPYGRPDSGTPESIPSITREDLLAFHQAWFGANNAILAIVGDIGTEEAFSGAERAFGNWRAAANPPPKTGDVPPPARRVVVIDRPGAVETEIRVGHVAVPRRSPDYLALDLATKILGGEGGNRLHRVLRSERSLTYGASADINALKEAGDIVAETGTKSETTGVALRLIVDEFWKLQRERVDDRELSDAQAYLTGNFPLTIETPSAIALQILNAVFYGLDLKELQTYRDRVNAITVDDIQRIARQYLHPDRLSIVLVGDASVFGTQLAGAGFDRYERIPLSDLDLASNDLRRHATPAGRMEQIGFTRMVSPPRRNERQQPAVTSAEETSVKALIDRAIRAKGGLRTLRSIRTMKAVATVSVLEGGQRVDVPTTTSIRYPGSFRLDAETPNGLLTQVFDNGEYWVKDARGVRTMAPGIGEQLRGNIQRDALTLLLALADGTVSATRAPDEKAAAGTLPAVQVAGGGMPPVVLVFDPETALIVRQRYQTSGSQMEEDYEDYRSVNGVQIAFKASVRRNGEMVLERAVRSVEMNVALPSSLFIKPS
jgi:zinc protease